MKLELGAMNQDMHMEVELSNLLGDTLRASPHRIVHEHPESVSTEKKRLPLYDFPRELPRESLITFCSSSVV